MLDHRDGLFPIGAFAGSNGTIYAPGQDVERYCTFDTADGPGISILSMATGAVKTEIIPNSICTCGHFFFENAGVGPDGNIWETVDQYDEFTPIFRTWLLVFGPTSGQYTSSFSSSDLELGAITTGPHKKDLWVATTPGWNSPRIFRMAIDTQGPHIARKWFLQAGASVAAMAAGPLNSVWFTDAGLNEIGRIAQDGSILYYPIPSANAGLAGITAGSDGAVWFVETNTNQIGRLATDGSITEFLVPTANARLSGIAGGPGRDGHGKVAFSESQAIGIVRF